MMQQPTTTMTLGGERSRAFVECTPEEREDDDDVEDSKRRREEEMMLEDDDPDNPANSKPKGPIGRARFPRRWL